MAPVPIADSYWVIEGWLLAGEYPGASSREASKARLVRFLDAGIRTFVDLTEPHELTRYDNLLGELAAERGAECRHLRYAIRDLGVPRQALLTRILDALRAELVEERPTYVHCWGGIGRTGTVIGCWLVANGLTGTQALARITDLRQGVPDAFIASPETEAQRRRILTWARRMREGDGTREDDRG